MRQFSATEIERLRVLTANEISLAFLEPTKTGLEKSIMDATAPVRLYLKEKELHDYDNQGQGPENKQELEAYFISHSQIVKSKCSVYRPNTKNGDPRIWFSGLNSYATANDILGMVAVESKLYVINISKLEINEIVESAADSPLKELIRQIRGTSNADAIELLEKLRCIAENGLIEAEVIADTGVGRTLEKALGLKINSSKNPDYKGIEIKSFRSNKKNRKTLFAQVPDWSTSCIKSSAGILDCFGYQSADDYTLRCTVSSTKPNSQGLYLKLDEKSGCLFECSTNPKFPEVAVWSLQKLHERLLQKHNETFWISAESHLKNGKEYFLYKSVEHTKKPIVSQFDILLSQGLITMDHLIKRDKDGKVVEKGPLFKIKPSAIALLFPPSQKYNLIQKN